jgi:hypothetical protein
MPVPYSPVMTSTPSTPKASWANRSPLRLVEAALKLALSEGDMAA